MAVLSRRRLGGAADITAAARHAGGLHEAQVYLRDTWHIAYGIDGISKLFRRRKLKTGRAHHRNSPAEQAAFKK